MLGPDDLHARRVRAASAWESHVARTDVRADRGGVRSEVLASWRRSAAHLHPGRTAAPVDETGSTAERWRDSPLYGPVNELMPELAAVATDDYVVAVTDAEGTIQFSLGGRGMRRAAEAVNFVPGGRWDEASVGTNALDLALRTGTPQQVFSAEHYSQVVHDWVCYSAPVLHPTTGRPLGVLDVSCRWEHAHPLALTAATALARNLQAQLDLAAGGATGGGRLELETLGAADGHAVRLDQQVVHVSPRQLELLTVLSLAPEGLGLQELHAALYPDHTATPDSCKAEVSHLRRLLGDRLGSRPYRLQGRLVADHLEVERLLGSGLVAAALARYGGPLLPRSESPAIVAQREYLHVALRSAVLASGDAALLLDFGDRHRDDHEVHEQALRLLADDDPRRALADSRLAQG